MMRSQSFSAWNFVVPVRLASVVSRCSVVTFPFDAVVEELLDARQPLVERALIDFAHDGLESRGRGRHLRDARAHQAAAEHADVLDLPMTLALTRTSILPIFEVRLVRLALHDRRNSLTAADARRGQAVPASPAAAVRAVSVSNRRVPVMPERMAERDRAAVDVGLLAIEAQLLLDGQILAGERLVDLDQVDVGQREPRASPAPCGWPAPAPCP